jgi:sulfite reductase alpha subunit-like flavoprotein
VEERVTQSESGGTAPVIFFFGCWNENNDFLFIDFWLSHSQKLRVEVFLVALISQGIGPATELKVYVQHKIDAWK